MCSRACNCFVFVCVCSLCTPSALEKTCQDKQRPVQQCDSFPQNEHRHTPLNILVFSLCLFARSEGRHWTHALIICEEMENIKFGLVLNMYNVSCSSGFQNCMTILLLRKIKRYFKKSLFCFCPYNENQNEVQKIT